VRVIVDSDHGIDALRKHRIDGGMSFLLSRSSLWLAAAPRTQHKEAKSSQAKTAQASHCKSCRQAR
jgi:hypothetical protein